MMQRTAPSENDYSLWVGDLTPEVDDYLLYKTFASRYQSVKCATVMMDAAGVSRTYGFIRFGNEEDQKHCLSHMNGYKGLGSKSIRISSAHRGSVSASGGYSSSLDYSASGSAEGRDSKSDKRQYSYGQEVPYWQSYLAWQSFEDSNSNIAHRVPVEMLPQALDTSSSQEDDLDLIEHNTKLDIESLNKDIIQRDYNFWDALECSKWIPVECYE